MRHNNVVREAHNRGFSGQGSQVDEADSLQPQIIGCSTDTLSSCDRTFAKEERPKVDMSATRPQTACTDELLFALSILSLYYFRSTDWSAVTKRKKTKAQQHNAINPCCPCRFYISFQWVSSRSQPSARTFPFRRSTTSST
jgi:hypothetical protein